ncbi:MAG: hypothetical protein PVG39_00215 [Desulfobacteraceae bacterium]|jgi:hypothetical protein
MPLNGAIQTGTVTSFSGANGLLQALLDFVAGTKVTGATTTGSGSGPYTATLTTTVGLGSVIINYTVGGIDFEAQDDGANGLNDATDGYISSGSIDYGTGAFTVTFTTTPDANPTIDYVHGDDGQDWEIKYQRNTRDSDKLTPEEPFGSDCEEVILHNRGLSGAENVLIGIREWKYVAGAAYGWDLTGYQAYTDGMYWGKTIIDDLSLDYDSLWDHFDDTPILPLIDDTMYYWFYSNRQRIVVIVKVQSNYECCYMGFANRFGNPEDYPYPLVIKGCGYGNINNTSTSQSNHSYIPYGPSNGTEMLHNVLPNNAWSINWGTGSTYFATWLFPTANWADTGQMYEAPAKKEVMMTPVIGMNALINAGLWELDGVYHVSGIGVQSEDYIRAHDGIKYRAFQDIARIEYDDWMGVAEIEFTTTSTSTTTTTTTSSTTTTTV